MNARKIITDKRERGRKCNWYFLRQNFQTNKDECLESQCSLLMLKLHLIQFCTLQGLFWPQRSQPKWRSFLLHIALGQQRWWGVTLCFPLSGKKWNKMTQTLISECIHFIYPDRSFRKRRFGTSILKRICVMRKTFSEFYISLALSVFIRHNFRTTDIINNIIPEVALNYFAFPNLIIKFILLQLPHLNRVFTCSLSWRKRLAQTMESL